MFQVGSDIIIFDREQQLCARIKDPVIAKAAKGLPSVQVLEGEDQLLVALPWCEDSCRLLQNIGIDTTGAAPIWNDKLPKIEGRYTPMNHQLFTAAFITLNPRCYVLNDPRTGKTGSIILATDYMQRHYMVTGGVLVITTVTTIPDVWAQSIRDTLPDAKVVIVHGAKREAALEQPADYYVTNYDSCRISTKAFIEAARSKRIGMVVIDEVTHIGNTSSRRHKSINTIVNDAGIKYAVGATGSPGGNAEVAFGICKVINRNRLPTTSKKTWLDFVTYQYGPEQFQRRISEKGATIIKNTMQPAVRFAKSDVIQNLPPVTVQNRTCAMSTEQMRMREAFKADAIALLESGEAVTAVNGGVLFHKLLQVAQGICMTNDGQVVHLDHKDRTKTILEAISETSRKVVIAGFYKATIAARAEEIKKAGYTVGIVDGSITGKRRSETLKAFQTEENPRVLIIHPTTTAYGVELASADTMIIDGPPPLGDHIWTQLLERLSSTKQTAAQVNIIRIISSPEEKKFYTTLDNGRQMGNFINILFEDYARGNL